MLDRILVPLDGTPEAEAILPEVGRLLRRKDSELLLLRAVNPMPVNAYPVAFESVLQEARAYVAALGRRLQESGAQARVIVRVGASARVILDVAREEKADLMALATHGRHGLKRVLLGSVTEEVLRKTFLPALVVRLGLERPPVNDGHPYRSILVPLDGSARGRAALPAAVEMARLFQSQLLLLHVTLGGAAGDPTAAHGQLKEIARTLEADGLRALALLETGEPVPAILEACRRHEIDLVAMATHGRRGLARLVLGSVTERVLRESPVPLLVVRSESVVEGGRAKERLGERAR